MGILEIVENFNKVDFSYLKAKPYISFLENYKNHKIIMTGYEKWETSLKTVDFKNVMSTDLSQYNLVVIGPKINFEKRTFIIKLVKFLESKKIDYIFYGYSSYCNLNLENTKKMFRPIDITKHPFNIKPHKILDNSFENKTIIIYFLTLILAIYLNIKNSVNTYKIFLLLVILFVLLIPRKKIVYIKNG
tara:strand:+ start:2239 stop:2805 length:567 start_codon:yes stop_codon:yes gene_type:complete